MPKGTKLLNKGAKKRSTGERYRIKLEKKRKRQLIRRLMPELLPRTILQG